MTQSTYLAHLTITKREPPEAAAIRQRAEWAKGWLAWMTKHEEQEARAEVRKLTAEWWKAVKQ